MLWERRWSRAEFDALRASGQTSTDARALVWGNFANGTLMTSFRIAEDNTLADSTDRPVVLDAAGSIGVVHPVHLAASELAAWATVIADYEILQPFPQIGRPHEPLDPEHLRGGVIPIQRTATRVKLARLYGQGWLSDPADSWPFFRIDEDRRLKLDIAATPATELILVKGLHASLGRYAGDNYDELRFAGIPLPFISEALGMVLPLLDAH